MQSPENMCTHGEEHEEPLILLSYAVVHPRAVMVHLSDASLANTATESTLLNTYVLGTPVTPNEIQGGTGWGTSLNNTYDKSLCSTGWHQTHDNSPALSFSVLRLQACVAPFPTGSFLFLPNFPVF